MDCILTTRGVQNFNCSSPMPVETVALYNCQRYFKQIYSSSPIKLMRCQENGEWSRMEHFLNLKCEYGRFCKIVKLALIHVSYRLYSIDTKFKSIKIASQNVVKPNP